ncbi:MAG: GNAT family N-acetyltransferase [Bacteroidota bacterium]
MVKRKKWRDADSICLAKKYGDSNNSLMNAKVSIISDRLLLEPLSLANKNFIYKLVNTKEWKKFIGDRNINSPEEASNYIQKILDNPDISYWVVKISGSMHEIGVITFIKRVYLEYHDIGFAFLPEHGNKGYAYEAVCSVINKLMPVYESPRVFATTIPQNKKSIKLLKKLGMELKKEILVDKEKLHVYTIASDQLRINELVQLFFGIFANNNLKQPDWNLLHRLCIPEALLISKQNNKQDVYTIQSFIEPRKKILCDGTLTEFVENEISYEINIQNNIAERHSRYQKSGIMNNKPFLELGNKFFQFVKTAEGWRITSVIWEDDRS